MNAQEKKIHINLTWSFVKSALLILGSLLGKDGLIEKVKDLLDGKDEEVSADDVPVTDEVKKDSHGCIIGQQIWNPSLNICQDDL